MCHDELGGECNDSSHWFLGIEGNLSGESIVVATRKENGMRNCLWTGEYLKVVNVEAKQAETIVRKIKN